MREVIIKSESDTAKLGLDLAKELKEGDILALVGDLGTGKTTLTKYIAKGLGIDETITSPTFTIVNEYNSGRIPLYHFDAYRLEGLEDAFNIGMEEYFDKGGVCIIEWADLVEEILPDYSKFIYLNYGNSDMDEERIYKCSF